MKLCECGCGLPAPISKETDATKGVVRGQPRRFIQYHNGHEKLDPTRHTVVDGGFSTPCWRYSGYIDRKGYGIIKSKIRPARLAHRISYEIAHGPVPPGLELDHLCRNKWCINPDHLEAVTHTENMQRGAVTTLNKELVLAIRSDRRRVQDIADQYGISRTSVMDVRYKKTWSSVPEPERPKIKLDWHPAETVPRDGSQIIICRNVRSLRQMVIAYWNSKDNRWVPAGSYPVEDGQFSHWMPLPEPPQ